MGQWGARWLEIEPRHMDPAYVLWATTKLVDPAKPPDRTVVVRFELRDWPADSYWLLLRKPHPELCTKGTGPARTPTSQPLRLPGHHQGPARIHLTHLSTPDAC
jgi:hypothetical protein